jgi:DNA (cytosine-5)-methyltransferase 1
MKLYEEIIFLQHFFKGKWVVENVKPFYETLIKPTSTSGRHIFWSNVNFNVDEEKSPKGFINKSNNKGKEDLMSWLDIYYEEKLYYQGNHCPCQVLRNCVHPKVGNHIMTEILRHC